MPAIKLKRVTAEYLAEKNEALKSQQSKVDESKDNVPDTPAKPEVKSKLNKKFLKHLDGAVLTEKRKRNVPAAEQKLMEWLDNNFEEREGSSVSLPSLYDYYAESCLFDTSKVVDIPIFNKMVRQKFGKGFAIKELSPYKGLIKEKKLKKKPSVQAESLRLKMKDIIEEALKEAGNPKKGVRFLWLKQYVAAKYPALRVDLKPGILKVALERGIRYGQVQLVRGIGFCGFYRLPLPDTTTEPEKAIKGKKKEENVNKTEGDVTEKSDVTDIASENGEEGTDEVDEEASTAEIKEEQTPSRKIRKRKKAKEEEESEEKVGKKKNTKRSKRGIKKKKQVQTFAEKCRIEDAFPLAITFMCEPKEASVSKIKRYLMDNYPEVNAEAKLKKALEKGVETGLWEQVTGTGALGTFRLLIEDFDPGKCETLDDMICLAIIATHEPKQASATLIKRYIQEFHPDFHTESRPQRFKNALKRATNKKIVRQLSGIGASGTFQLINQYTPSPALLAGAEVDQNIDNDTESYEETYYVRPTKSRGRGRGVTVIIGKKSRR